MMKWEYGGSYLRQDMEGEISLPHRSMVMACDWIEHLPEWMKDADTLFIDPPWNKGNVNTFYTKAGLPHPAISFDGFSRQLWCRIDEIQPKTLFIEMGKENLAAFIVAASGRYRYVTFYNSTYYRKKGNKCYVIHASDYPKHRRYPVLEDLDEHDIIKWICFHHECDCIGDLCMGTGLVGRYAFEAGKRFVGTELNPRRLAVLVEFIRNATTQSTPQP